MDQWIPSKLCALHAYNKWVLTFLYVPSCPAFDEELEFFHHYHYKLFCRCHDPFLDHLLVCFLLVKIFFVKIQVLFAFVHHANLFWCLWICCWCLQVHFYLWWDTYLWITTRDCLQICYQCLQICCCCLWVHFCLWSNVCLRTTTRDWCHHNNTKTS